MTERHIPIEISVATDSDERPCVDSGTRIDVSVNGQLYPTSRLEDGRYVAWWFDTDPPEPDAPATTEWVAAPTRFLAAGTLHELWEDPAAFDDLVESETDPDPDLDPDADPDLDPDPDPDQDPDRTPDPDLDPDRTPDPATTTDTQTASGTGGTDDPIEGSTPPNPSR